MPTLFTKIVNGEIPCHKILENEDYLAFLDVRPVMAGHTLVITKKEVEYVFDVEDKLLAGLMVFSKRVAKMIQAEVPCKKIGVMVAGIEVPHVHIHLIPIWGVHDLSFAKAKDADQTELAGLAQRIRRHAA